MPTYDYKCEECDHLFEAFQSMSAEPLKDCPKCEGAVKRMIHGGTGLIFKGSGFYLTDYKNKTQSGGKKASGGDGSEKKPETKKTEDKAKKSSGK